MKKLNELFREAYNTSITDLITIPDDLVPFPPEKGADAYNFLTPISLSKRDYPYIVQGDIQPFLKEAPEGYFHIGYWGHGVNSYAFYYVRVDSKSKIFFRLHYGGFYSNAEEDGKHGKRFLENFFAFEKKIEGIVDHFIAVESMGRAHYLFTMNDDQEHEYRKSLFRNANFLDQFKELLEP